MRKTSGNSSSVCLKWNYNDTKVVYIYLLYELEARGSWESSAEGKELKETDASWVEGTEWRMTVTEGSEDPHLALEFPLPRSIERLIK